MRKTTFIILMSICACYPVELVAQKSTSSSSRSSSSTSTRSSSSFSRPSSSSTPTRSNSNFSKPNVTAPKTQSTQSTQTNRKSSNFTTSTKTATKTNPQTKVDQKVNKLATTNAKTVTKEQAVQEFKKTHSSTYTSKYKSEPKVRPKHIPQTTNVNGSNVNVYYNSGYGGYGYIHPITGTWMMYDMMSDVVMMNAMMSNHHYPIAYGTYNASWMLIFPIMFILCVVVLFIWKVK